MSFLSRVRLIVAIAGMIFLLAGVATENRTIVWGAIALLGLSLLIRLYLRRRD